MNALVVFWKQIRKKGIVIKNVTTDLSAAFISSIMENAPQVTHVFDHFHVVKLMDDVLDNIRRTKYNQEKNLNKRKVMKGIRYLLMRNGKEIF